MTDKTVEISTVIPVYKSSGTLDELYRRLATVLDEMTDSWEMVLINDGSPDESWEKLKELSRKDNRVVSINLMRNFGQQNALMCGFRNCKGAYVVTMDDDLQHPPEEIVKLIREIEKGEADVVVASYQSKRHSISRKIGTFLAKRLAFYTLSIPTSFDMTSFRIIRKEIIDEVVKFNSSRPRVGLILFTITRSIVNVKTEHRARKGGRSGYSLSRLMSDFVDGILNYSSLPLRLASYVGLVSAFISFTLAFSYVTSYFFGAITVSGFTSIAILITFFAGLILMTSGITGEYLMRIVRSTEYNPQFIIREKRGNSLFCGNSQRKSAKLELSKVGPRQMKKDVLMILGAKYEQIPMMLKARQMGYKTVAVDFNKHPAGADHCDFFYTVSYSDEEKVAAIASKHNVAGIGTIGTNNAILVAGRVSQQLRLPGLYDTTKTIERAVYKDLWRPVLEDNGVPIAKGQECKSVSEAEQAVSMVGYPALFKPADASGSKGVTIVSRPEDIREYFNEAMSFSLSGTVIVEKYLGHNSFEVESFVVDGTIHLVTTGERKLPPPPICAGLGCTVPDSLSPERRNRIDNVNRATIKALEITYGPVHLDMVFDESGIPHVIDVGPRLVAGPIGWQHIPKTTGVDMVEAVILQAVGEKAKINPKETGLYCATRHITSKKDGVLDHLYRAEDRLAEHNIVSFEFFPQEGDKIHRLQHGGHRYGFVTAWDHSYEGVCQRIDSFMEKISFHFKDGTGNEENESTTRRTLRHAA